MQRQIVSETRTRMNKSIESLKRQFSSVRSGKASPQALEEVKIDYYGTPTPLNQVGSISVPEAQLLIVQPWEKAMVDPIVKAIQSSNLGFNPQPDGQVIRIPVPPLTEERRRELVKIVKKYAEDAKVAVRNIRRDANDEIKKVEKTHDISEDQRDDALDDIQELTNKAVELIDQLSSDKEAEVMSV